MGEMQDLKLLLRTARLLKQDAKVHFFVFGDGAVKQDFLQCCKEWSLTNVTHAPFQEREMLPHMLYGADLVLLSQRHEVIDIVVPSKLVTAMGAGAMIVAACPRESETASVLALAKGGIVIEPSDENALAEVIRRVRGGAEDVDMHRTRVRSYAQRNFDRRSVYSKVTERVAEFALAKSHNAD
jgi:colanic acid biosynthesis glycosyl transferase WcaI